jgi:hypothetical protein
MIFGKKQSGNVKIVEYHGKKEINKLGATKNQRDGIETNI